MNINLKQAPTTTVPAKPATTIGAIFGATPGMPGMFKSNFDYQLVRGMVAGAYGEGGAFGELYSTARRVVDRDINSWAVEWGRHRRADRGHSPQLPERRACCQCA